MSDIGLVIKIPKELYEAYKGKSPMLGDAGMDMIAQSIANGTPLPKGQPCEDAISRSDAINSAIDAVDEWDGGCNTTRANIITKAINGLPSVQSQRRVGKWIPLPTGLAECSICHDRALRTDSFCSNCGADMLGDEEC